MLIHLFLTAEAMTDDDVPGVQPTRSLKHHPETMHSYIQLVLRAWRGFSVYSFLIYTSPFKLNVWTHLSLVLFNFKNVSK